MAEDESGGVEVTAWVVRYRPAPNLVLESRRDQPAAITILPIVRLWPTGPRSNDGPPIFQFAIGAQFQVEVDSSAYRVAAVDGS